MAVSNSLAQIAVATVLGYLLDRWLGWIFWTPVGVCAGMALAIRTLLYFLKQFTPTPSKSSGQDQADIP